MVIAGGGPTGLTLASELALAGVDVAIVERRTNQELDSLRAGGLHARTIEMLDQRGLAERFIAQGQAAQIVSFARVRLDISDFPTRHNYGLALRQHHIEGILLERVSELDVPVYRDLEVIGVTQDASGVEVELSDGKRLRPQYLVGCDGGRSVVRRSCGIEFAGWDPSISYLIAEVELAQEPEWGVRRDEHGTYAIGKHEDGTRAGVVLREEQIGQGEPTLGELRDGLTALYGTDFGLRRATYLSRFTDMARQAVAYRSERVLLAGDAAHVHSPIGGQGLNTGVQDAMNLGWKLAQVVNGTAPETLLDSYHAERHPVGARALQNTLVFSAVERGEARVEALCETMAVLLQMDEPRKKYAALMSGLDIRYDMGAGHPLLGRRMPDLDVVTADGPRRVFTLLHDARPVFLNLGEPGRFDISPWADRVRVVDAHHAGVWELPVVGVVTPPSAVVIRPDGYVAWVGEATSAGLDDALTTWFGPPAAGWRATVLAAVDLDPMGMPPA